MNIGRIAVVTGSARGIGAQVARDLTAAGYTVIVSDRDGAAAEVTATEIGAHGYALDVTNAASVAAFVERVEREHGPIAVWVNNAGIMPTGPFLQQEPAEAEAILAVNLGGVLTCTRAVLPGMVERGRGTIVQIASATATKPIAGLAVYSGSKGAVLSFSRALRRELRGTGVHVAAVLPYLADTALGASLPAQRFFRQVTPAEVSSGVLRAIRHRRGIQYVPGILRWGPWFLDALPQGLADRIDDLLKTDGIGLGGDPAVRGAYRREALGESERP